MALSSLRSHKQCCGKTSHRRGSSVAWPAGVVSGGAGHKGTRKTSASDTAPPCSSQNLLHPSAPRVHGIFRVKMSVVVSRWRLRLRREQKLKSNKWGASLEPDDNASRFISLAALASAMSKKKLSTIVYVGLVMDVSACRSR